MPARPSASFGLRAAALTFGLAWATALPAQPSSDAGSVEAATGDGFQAALSARLALGDSDGRTITTPTAGQSFSLEVTLSDAASGSSPRGLSLEGWLRPVSATDLPCREAARAFRATRRIPTGGIDLNGILLASFNRDGSFAITDPRLDLASANMVAAGRAGDGPPDLLAADPASQRLYFPDPAGGGLIALSTNGKMKALPIPEPGQPVALVPDGAGGVWTAAGSSLWRLDGEAAAFDLSAPILGVRAAGPEVLVAWTREKLVFVNRRSGADLATSVAPDIRAADAVALTDPQGGTAIMAAVLTGDGRAARLVYADAPEAAQSLTLPAAATRVDAQPDGAMILFWDPSGAISLVDPVSGTLAGALAIHAGISAIAFADRAAFLMAADGSAVTVVDLGSVGRGKAPALQEVRLGPRAARAADPRLTEGLLATLSPAPRAIAVHAETSTMFVIEAQSSMGEAPPMTGGRLRGGLPHRIAVLDRSFRETLPGRFRTMATIPNSGPHELVLTTGIAGLSTCFRIDVNADPAAPVTGDTSAARPARLTLLPGPVPVPGVPGTLRLALTDADGATIPLSPPPQVTVTSLETGWRVDAMVTPAGEAMIDAQVSLPLPGLYLVRVEGIRRVLDPAILEVR